MSSPRHSSIFGRLALQAIRVKDGLIPSIWPDLVTASYPHMESPEEMERRRILVFSPHQDDEVLGCGGTLLQYVRSGTRIKVVYMTDGRYGNPRYDPEDIVEIRNREAQQGLKILKCEDATFLNYPDSGLRLTEETTSRVLSIVEEYDPDAIFLPYPFDNHIDHVRTAVIVASALKRFPHELDCYCYEVWSALPPNVVYDITRDVQRKIDAIREHKTQIEMIDYVEKIIGLNAFRSLTLGNGARYCEAFFKCSRKGLIRLVETGTQEVSV